MTPDREIDAARLGPKYDIASTNRPSMSSDGPGRTLFPLRLDASALLALTDDLIDDAAILRAGLSGAGLLERGHDAEGVWEMLQQRFELVVLLDGIDEISNVRARIRIVASWFQWLLHNPWARPNYGPDVTA